MSWQIILFFLAGPIIIGIGNLVLGPIFSKHIPFKSSNAFFLSWNNDLFTFSYYWILLIVARKNLDYVV